MKKTSDILIDFEDNAIIRNTNPRTLELQNVQFECDNDFIIPFFASTEYDDSWYKTYYEPRIMSKHIIQAKTHKFISQFDYVIDKLINDTATRQAMLIMASETEYARDGLMMCLISMQFFLDGNTLKTYVNMRSSDIFRYNQDLAWQKKIRNKIAKILSKKLKVDIECANIVWNVGSLHLYEHHWDQINANNR